MTAAVDARVLNWRFVVPDEPEGLLLLPANGERLPGAVVVESRPDCLASALHRGPYPAIAVPDLGAWTSRRRRAAAGALLARLCAGVGQAGWLYVGFANPWYPGAPARPGSLRVRTALRVLRRSGLSEFEVFFALPSQRRPALLVPTARRMELDHVLHRLFLTYVPAAESPWPTLRRQVLAVLRRGALIAPHRSRMQFAPAFGVVARRPR
jgi:hypothetical protein